MTYVDLGPDDQRRVLVRLEDGVWCEGTLTSYRKVEGVWSGHVEYQPTPGDDRRGWFEEGRIRGAGVLDVLSQRADDVPGGGT